MQVALLWNVRTLQRTHLINNKSQQVFAISDRSYSITDESASRDVQEIESGVRYFTCSSSINFVTSYCVEAFLNPAGNGRTLVKTCSLRRFKDTPSRSSKLRARNGQGEQACPCGGRRFRQLWRRSPCVCVSQSQPTRPPGNRKVRSFRFSAIHNLNMY